MSAQFQAMAGTTRPVADIRPVAGNVNDNANHGTPRSAVGGSCLVGNSSMFAVLPSAMNSQIVSSFCWVNPTINGDVLQTFVTESGAESASYPWLFGMTATGELRVILRDTYNVNGKDYRTTTLLQNGIWTHVGFTYNGTDLRVYINGQEQTVNRVVDNVLGNLLLSSSVGIGAKAQGDIPFASEIISIVSYSTELTVDDIQLLLKFKYLGSESYLLKLDEANGNTVYDASGNGNHGTITNPYVNQWGRQDIYSYANQEGFTDSSGVRLPAISPLLDVNNNPLQYKGKAQQNGSLVEAACFQGDNTGLCTLGAIPSYEVPYYQIEFSMYATPALVASFSWLMSIQSNLSPRTGWSLYRRSSDERLIYRRAFVEGSFTDVGITVEGGQVNTVAIKSYGTTVQIRVNGVLQTDTGSNNPTVYGTGNSSFIGCRYNQTSPLEDSIWGIKYSELDFNGNVLQVLGEWPLSEPIIDPANHTYFDVSGSGNHATLINGSAANEGVQDDYHYLETYGYTLGTGSNGAPLNHYIPASQANPTQDAAGNTLQFPPTEWLGVSKLKFPETPECIQANARLGKYPIGWTLFNMTQDGNDFTGAVTVSWDDTAYGDYTVDGIQFTAQDTRSGMVLLDDTVNSGTYKTAKAYMYSNGSQWVVGSVNVNNQTGVLVKNGDIGELRFEDGVVNAYVNGDFLVQVYNGVANYPKVSALINETAFEVFTTLPTFTATGEAVAISKGDISTNIGKIGGKTYIGSNSIRVHSNSLGSVKDKAEKIRTNN